MTESQQKAQLTQEILIHSATWWMSDAEKIAFLTQTIIAIAAAQTKPLSGRTVDPDVPVT